MRTYLIPVMLMLVLNASNADAQNLSVGVFGGINFQNLNGKDPAGAKLDNSLITGFNAGADVQIPIAPEFFFQPGLLITGKGARDNNIASAPKYRLTYLELPLNVVYKGLVGKGYVMLGLGPYLGYALGGTVKSDAGSDKIRFTNVVAAGEPMSATFFRRFDAGANIFAGYELANRIFFRLNTQLGLISVNPEDNRIMDDKASIKNTGFGISAGYRF